MKKMFFAFSLMISITSFGTTYSGLDEKGEVCHLTISDVPTNAHLIFIQATSSHVISSVYTLKNSKNISERTVFHQGDHHGTLRTTDHITVGLENSVPTSFAVTRKRAVKGNSIFSSYRTNDHYGTTKVTCVLH